MSFDPNYEFVEPLPTLNPAGNYALRGREISSGTPVTILLLPAHSRESIMGDINSLPPDRRSAILKVGEWRGMMFVVTASRTEEAPAKQAPAEPLTPKVLSRAGVWKVPSSVSPPSVEAAPVRAPSPPPPPPPKPAPMPVPGEVSGFTALPPDPAKPAPSKDGPGEFTLMFQSPASAAAKTPPTVVPVDRSPLLGEVTLTTEPSVFQNPPQPAPKPFASEDVTVESSTLHKPASPALEPGEFTRMFQTSVRPSQQNTPTENLAPPASPPAAAEPGEFTQMFLKPRADSPIARAPEPPPAPRPVSPPSAAGEFTQLFQTPTPDSSSTPPAVETPKLLIEGREGSRKLFPLDKPQLILGRSESVELSYPDDNRLSREHFKLTRINDEWWVEDLRSKNGTFLNGRMLAEKTAFNRGDSITAGRLAVSFQVPPSEVETVTFAPGAPTPADAPSDFMRLFQPDTMSGTNVAVQSPLPPPPEPSAPPGGFTQLFQALPPTPSKAPQTAPPVISKVLTDNDATRLFDVKSSKPVAAKPAPPPPAAPPGEFTQMFQAPSRPASVESYPAASAPAAPPAARPSTPPQPGEFTRIMESPMAPAAFRPGAPAPPAYAPPPPPPKQQEGEFTRMFGVGNGARTNTPPPPPPPSGPGDMGATRAFSVPQQQPSYSAPQGPSEFTRMFSVPEPAPMAAKPPAPAATPAVAPAASGPSPKLLIILLAVFAVLAVIIVVVFALRK